MARISLSKLSPEARFSTTPQKQPFHMSLIPHIVRSDLSCLKSARIYFLPSLGLLEVLPRFRWSRISSTFSLASSLNSQLVGECLGVGSEKDLQTNETVLLPNIPFLGGPNRG